MRVVDGHLVIPYLLPIHVPTELRKMPVEEFFGLNDDPDEHQEYGRPETVRDA
jgi:hypothetical protein